MQGWRGSGPVLDEGLGQKMLAVRSRYLIDYAVYSFLLLNFYETNPK